MRTPSSPILARWEMIIAMLALATTPFFVSPITFDSYLLPKYCWLTAWAALWLVLIVFQVSPRAYQRGPLDWPIAAFLTVTFLSILVQYRTPLQFRAFFNLVLFVGLFYAFRRLWTLLSSPLPVFRLLAVVATLLAIQGILQDYGVELWSNTGGVRDWRAKVVATLGNPNFLAGYLGISLPPIVALGLRRQALWRDIILSALATLCITACIALTFCVGVTIALAGTAGLIGFFLLLTRTQLSLPYGRTLLLAALALAGAAWYLADNPYNRHGESLYREAMRSPQWWSGFGSRQFNWRTTRIMMDEHPFTGIGFGNYLTVHAHYQGLNYAGLENDAHDREIVAPVDQPHFQFLETASESGPLGVFTSAWLVTAWVVASLKRLRTHSTGYAWGAYLGVWVAVIHSFSCFPFHLPANALLVVALAAYVVREPRDPQAEIPASGWIFRTISLGCALAMLVMAYSLMQGNRLLRMGLESQSMASAAYLEDARQNDPFNFQVYHLLGTYYAAYGWPNKAIAAFERALWLQEDQVAHQRLAQIYDKIGNKEKAIAEQRRVIAINPIYPGHHQDLARLLRQAGQEDEAQLAEEEADRLEQINAVKYAPAVPAQAAP